MSDPKWLTADQLVHLNKAVVEVSNEPHLVRDRGLLESALGRPRNMHAYGEGDAFHLAASYAEGVALNHPFAQGNKRTAFLSAEIFLSLNGYELQRAQGREHADMMVRLVEGEATRDDMARHLSQHSREIGREEVRDNREKDAVKVERPRDAKERMSARYRAHVDRQAEPSRDPERDSDSGAQGGGDPEGRGDPKERMLARHREHLERRENPEPEIEIERGREPGGE